MGSPNRPEGPHTRPEVPGGTGAEERSDVATELLKNKISRDCIGLINSYLHANDLEFVKAALDWNYKPDIKFKSTNVTEYDVLCEIDWCLAMREYKFNPYIYYVVERNFMKVLHKIYKYLTQGARVELFKYHIDDIITKNICEYVATHDVQLFYSYPDALYEIGMDYNTNFLIDYLYSKEVPFLNRNTFYYETVIETNDTFELTLIKFNWLYEHKQPLTLNVFTTALFTSSSDIRLEIIQWLLNHNCPYQP